MWDLWRHLTFKIDLHSPSTPKPSKNVFLLQQDWFLEGFGVPRGCKSILNVKILHKSYIIAKLFGLRIFFWWVKKKVWSRLFGDFCADLKKLLIIFSSYVSTLFQNELLPSIFSSPGTVSKNLSNQNCSKIFELYVEKIKWFA